MRSILIATLLVFSTVQPVRIFGQGNEPGHWPETMQLQRFAADDGLPMAGVSCLYQDSQGFLWVGTFTGLNRFDGYRFIAYRNDIRDKNSISDVNISSIYETRSGQIWVGTVNGLNKYDRRTNGFRSFHFDANDPTSQKNSYIRSIFEDSRGTLWVGTNGGGLSKYDEASGGFVTYSLTTPRSNTITGIAEDKSGGL